MFQAIAYSSFLLRNYLLSQSNAKAAAKQVASNSDALRDRREHQRYLRFFQIQTKLHLTHTSLEMQKISRQEASDEPESLTPLNTYS